MKKNDKSNNYLREEVKKYFDKILFELIRITNISSWKNNLPIDLALKNENQNVSWWKKISSIP